MVATSINQCL